MKAVVVIADAGPLIALARIGHLHLLREIFSNVLITATVQQEVLLGGDFADSARLENAIHEHSIITYPRRVGNWLCFIDLCPRAECGRSFTAFKRERSLIDEG